jgi:CRP-like cAMP-binding protein
MDSGGLGCIPERRFVAELPGVSVFEQGSPVRAVAILEEGLVKLLRWENPEQSVNVGFRVARWPLGSAAAILGTAHGVTAETLTRCRILSIAIGEFLNLIKNNGLVSADLHRIHSRELMDYVGHLGGLGALSTRDRLLRKICEIAIAQNGEMTKGPLRIALPLSYTDLASAIVTTRQHLSRVLRRLEDENLIRRQRGGIVIPNVSKFRAAMCSEP